ncbi:MAG: single-stranded-DNA-specific exonuclease RecJ [Chloroflexota bacterium]
MTQHILKVAAPAPPELLSARASYPPLLAQLLYNRGLTSPQDWDCFLAGDERLCADPMLLPEIGQAIERIRRALRNGEKIAVYGDYDTDGVTATAAIVEGLETLGADLIPYIPHRQEGHGLQIPVLERLYQQGATLVITADSGTTCYPEVDRAQKRGQDIIITDHHSPPDVLPPAVALVNPKHPNSVYPFRDLAGVGVAYKFVQGLLRSLGKSDTAVSGLDLVTLGTVADVAPLRGENRYFVKQGLRMLRQPHRPGLIELIGQARLDPEAIDTDAIACVLGPRLNAAGRVQHAALSYQLLMTGDAIEGRRIAVELERLNQERQRLTEQALVVAREMAQEQKDSRLLLVASRDFSVGVAGLVAGKLAEEFRRPAVVVRYGAETCRGSCRSIPEFDMVGALKECSQLLLRYGGHPMAAGFNIATPQLKDLQQRLQDKAARALDGLDLRPQLQVDAQMPLEQLDGSAIAACQKLAPCGFGNPYPTFLSPGVRVVEAQQVGNSRAHLRLKFKAGRIVWDGIYFRCDEPVPPRDTPMDIVYSLRVGHRSGQSRMELQVLDIQPSPT